MLLSAASLTVLVEGYNLPCCIVYGQAEVVAVRCEGIASYLSYMPDPRPLIVTVAPVVLEICSR